MKMGTSNEQVSDFDFGEILVSAASGGEEEVVEKEEQEVGGEVNDEVKEEEPSEVELLKAQLKEKDNVIANLSKREIGKEEEKKESQEPEVQVTWTDANYIDEDFDFNTLTPEKFNAILNQVAKSAAENGARTAVAKSLLALPEAVKHTVKVHSDITTAVNKFYKDNSDLKEFSKVVATVAQEIASENPELTLDELFAKAGDVTRGRLNIAKKAKAAQNKAPAVNVGGQQIRKGAQVSGLEKEIGELLDS
jgi:hypothetical protein